MSIIKIAEERGEFTTLEDGYVYFEPYLRGALSPANLRHIAQELDDRNAVWDEQVKLGRAPNPLWTEGLKVIDRMIVTLLDAGFTLVGGDDGGDEYLPVTTRKAAIELVASVDESALHFRRAGYEYRSVVSLIPGNGPDAICDHSTGDPEFTRVLDSLVSP